MTDTERRLDVAERAAVAGGERALDTFRGDLAVETKANKTDLVTGADREAQARVAATIREEFPDDPVVGEEDEGPKTVPAEGPAWVIDPIDGTNNYVRGLRTWATSVTALDDGEPVASANVLPALGDRYVASGSDEVRRNDTEIGVSQRTDPETFAVAPTIWWDFHERETYAAVLGAIVERFGDLRRFGCAQATLAAVADGSLDGTLTTVETNPWDTIAGVHLVRAAGGVVTDLAGEPWRHTDRGLVASNGNAHGIVLEAARAAIDRSP